MEIHRLSLIFLLSCGSSWGEVPVPQDDGSGLDLTGWSSGSDLSPTGSGLSQSNRVTFVSPSPPALKNLYGTYYQPDNLNLQTQSTDMEDTEKSSGRGLLNDRSILGFLTAPLKLSGLARFNILSSLLGQKNRRQEYTSSNAYAFPQGPESRVHDYEDMYDLAVDSDSTPSYKRKKRRGRGRGRKRRRRRRRKPKRNRFRRPKSRTPSFDYEDSQEKERNIVHPVKTSYSYVTHHHDLKHDAENEVQSVPNKDRGSTLRSMFRNLFGGGGGQRESGVGANNEIQESFKFNKIRSEKQTQNLQNHKKLQHPKSIYDKLKPSNAPKTFHPSPLPTKHVGILGPPLPPPTPPFQSYSYQYVITDNPIIPLASFTSSSVPKHSYYHSSPSGLSQYGEFEVVPEIPGPYLLPPAPLPTGSGDFQASFSNRYPRVYGHGISQYHNSPPPSPLPMPIPMLLGPGRLPIHPFHADSYPTAPFRRMHLQQSAGFLSNGGLGMEHNHDYENFEEAESTKDNPEGTFSQPQIIYGKWNPLLDKVETTAGSSHLPGSEKLNFIEDSEML